MELVTQYFNLKGEVDLLLYEIKTESKCFDNPNVENMTAKTLEKQVDELLGIIRHLRKCKEGLKAFKEVIQ